MPMRINMSAITGAGATVKSIQPFFNAINNGQSQGTTTLSTPVDMDKSFIITSGSSSYQTDPAYIFTTVVLTNSNTITATRIQTSNPCYSTGTVVEFSNGIASVQRGTITMLFEGASSTQIVDTSITAVSDTSKCIITMSFTATSHTSPVGGPVVYLTSTTNIRATRYQQSKYNEINVAYEVIEFE